MYDSEENSIKNWCAHVGGFAKVVEGGGHEMFRPALDEGILLGVRSIFVSRVFVLHGFPAYSDTVCVDSCGS